MMLLTEPNEVGNSNLKLICCSNSRITRLGSFYPSWHHTARRGSCGGSGQVRQFDSFYLAPLKRRRLWGSDERAGSSRKRLELTRLNRRGVTFSDSPFTPPECKDEISFFENRRMKETASQAMYTIWKDSYDPRKFLLSIHPRNFGNHVTVRPYVRTDAEGGGRESGASLLGGGGVCYSWALACAKGAQRSTIGKKIWLSMHPRNFQLVMRRSSIRP